MQFGKKVLYTNANAQLFIYKYFTSIQLSTTGEYGKEVHDGGHLFQNLSCSHLLFSRIYSRKTVGSIVLPMIYP